MRRSITGSAYQFAPSGPRPSIHPSGPSPSRTAIAFAYFSARRWSFSVMLGSLDKSLLWRKSASFTARASGFGLRERTYSRYGTDSSRVSSFNASITSGATPLSRRSANVSGGIFNHIVQPCNGFGSIALYTSCNMSRMHDVGFSRFVHLTFMSRSCNRLRQFALNVIHSFHLIKSSGPNPPLKQNRYSDFAGPSNAPAQ